MTLTWLNMLPLACDKRLTLLHKLAEFLRSSDSSSPRLPRLLCCTLTLLFRLTKLTKLGNFDLILKSVKGAGGLSYDSSWLGQWENSFLINDGDADKVELCICWNCLILWRKIMFFQSKHENYWTFWECKIEYVGIYGFGWWCCCLVRFEAHDGWEWCAYVCRQIWVHLKRNFWIQNFEWRKNWIWDEIYSKKHIFATIFTILASKIFLLKFFFYLLLGWLPSGLRKTLRG